MISRLPGAIARAILVVIMIATPSLMLTHVSSDTTQIVVLIAVFASVLTLFEYVTAYPGLVEFRDAPPFNRIRFAALFITLLLLSVVVRGGESSTSAHFIEAVGTLIGKAIDFPYSPVRLIVLMLPENASGHDIVLLRTMAGVSYLISLMSLAVFLVTLRLTRWPHSAEGFNVWINLPTFDPTVGGDVVERLERDARFNIALGFLLPFISPAIVQLASGVFGSVSLANEQTMIWTIAAWAFLPASLFMRGIAMQRVATMITEQRQRNTTTLGEDMLTV